MFVENAGNFYNLTKQTQMPNIDLRPYLNQTLFFTASAKESRVQNFQELISEIDSLIKTTDSKGSNVMLEQNPSYYEDLVGKILGYSFARFKELENPSKAMFEFLNNIKSALKQELEPTLFSSGRPLETADIYDFLSVSIKSGIPSDETSKLLDLLPQLKAKQEAFKVANTTTQRNGNGNHHNGNNGIINSSSADNHNKQISLENNEKNIKTQGITEEIKGKGFTAQNPQNVTKPLKVEFDMQEWAKLTSGIKLDAQLRADLENLATKHPEMFKKPSDVFKLLMKIKNNPTHFLPNNRDDVAMIAKILDNHKIARMGVRKNDNEVVHLTSRNQRESDKRGFMPLAVESPTHSTLLQKQNKAGANAHLLKDNLNSTTNTQNLQVRTNTTPSFTPDTIIDGDVPYPLTQRANTIPQANPHNANIALRANTIPEAVQEEIIDVEVIQKYITHTPRNKIREDLSDLPILYPRLFLDKGSVLQNALKMLNNPKLLEAPKTTQQKVIKETLAKKSGAYKQGSLFDEKDLAEIPQNNAVVKENLTTQDSAQNKVSLENKKILNQRIKEFANALDEYNNPQNIEVKDIDSLVKFINGWRKKPLTTEEFLREPLDYRFEMNPKSYPQYDELIQDISA